MTKSKKDVVVWVLLIVGVLFVSTFFYFWFYSGGDENQWLRGEALLNSRLEKEKYPSSQITIGKNVSSGDIILTPPSLPN